MMIEGQESLQRVFAGAMICRNSAPSTVLCSFPANIILDASLSFDHARLPGAPPPDPTPPMPVPLSKVWPPRRRPLPKPPLDKSSRS